MNDFNQFSLGDALNNLLRKHGLEETMNEHRIKGAWDKTVGSFCSNHTESVRFSKGELRVKISSALVKQEIMYAKTDIIMKINEILEQELVTSIRIY